MISASMAKEKKAFRGVQIHPLDSEFLQKTWWCQEESFEISKEEFSIHVLACLKEKEKGRGVSFKLCLYIFIYIYI